MNLWTLNNVSVEMSSLIWLNDVIRAKPVICKPHISSEICSSSGLIPDIGSIVADFIVTDIKENIDTVMNGFICNDIRDIVLERMKREHKESCERFRTNRNVKDLYMVPETDVVVQGKIRLILSAVLILSDLENSHPVVRTGDNPLVLYNSHSIKYHQYQVYGCPRDYIVELRIARFVLAKLKGLVQ